MPLALKDRLAGDSRVDAGIISGVLAKIDRPDAKDIAFLGKLAEYASKAGLDAAILIAQHLVETANQTSVRWNNDLNPGGVGIPSDSTVQPFKITSADSAAAIMVQCVYAMVYKKTTPAVPVPAEAADWFEKVWIPKVNGVGYPNVATIDDLDARYLDADNEPQATWAWDGTDDGDPSYADKVVARGNFFMPVLASSEIALASETSVAITYGRVPMPYFYDRPITKSEGSGQNNLGKREVFGVCLHRMLGTLWGTNGYFALPTTKALTDYGVGVLYQDGAENDGLIIRWNDPEGYQSGWASGPVSSPYGDAKRFVEKYGVNAPNKHLASIEISGIYYSTPFSAEAKRSVARLIAYHADQAEVPWDVFPLNPRTGLSFVFHHQGFTIGTGKVCSGDVVMEATSELIAMAKEMLRDAQIGSTTQPPATSYRKPKTYPWMFPGHPEFGQDHFVGKTEYIFLPVDVTANQNTPRYATTGPHASLAGPDIEEGVTFHSDWCFRSYNVSYRLTRNGVRVRSAALWPRDNISVKGTVTRYHEDTQPGNGEIVRRRPEVDLAVDS